MNRLRPLIPVVALFLVLVCVGAALFTMLREDEVELDAFEGDVVEATDPEGPHRRARSDVPTPTEVPPEIAPVDPSSSGGEGPIERRVVLRDRVTNELLAGVEVLVYSSSFDSNRLGDYPKAAFDAWTEHHEGAKEPTFILKSDVFGRVQWSSAAESDWFAIVDQKDFAGLLFLRAREKTPALRPKRFAVDAIEYARITVRDDRGRPVPDYQVRLDIGVIGYSLPRRVFRTDARGVARIICLPRLGRQNLSDTPYRGWYVSALDGLFRRAPRVDLHEAFARGGEATLRLPATGTLEIAFTFEGKPLRPKAARLSLWPEASNRNAEDRKLTTDPREDDGIAVFEGVELGIGLHLLVEPGRGDTFGDTDLRASGPRRPDVPTRFVATLRTRSEAERAVRRHPSFFR